MAKTCPSCGYRPIGPFTDNCPICAEPVRNVRSDSPGKPGGMPPWLRWMLGAAFVGVLGVGGCCGMGMFRMGSALQDAQKMMEQAKAQMEADRKARTVVVKAADLLQEFQADHAAADRKYKNKILELSGIVERSGRGGGGVPFMILHGGDENAPLKLECFLDFALVTDEAPGRGEAVILRGDYAGQVTHLQVRGCTLVR